MAEREGNFALFHSRTSRGARETSRARGKSPFCELARAGDLGDKVQLPRLGGAGDKAERCHTPTVDDYEARLMAKLAPSR